jgi:glutathione peroxidase-family protein
MASIYDFSARTLDGASAPLGVYKGKTLLIVNVDSIEKDISALL